MHPQVLLGFPEAEQGSGENPPALPGGGARRGLLAT